MSVVLIMQHCCVDYVINSDCYFSTFVDVTWGKKNLHYATLLEERERAVWTDVASRS